MRFRGFFLLPFLVIGCATGMDDPVGDSHSASTTHDAPLTERPIIFIHGHSGSHADGNAIFAALTAPGERFDAVTFAGTSDHAAWATESLPRRAWLFSFSYYTTLGTDPRASFTAGPGRVGSNGHLVPDHSSYDADSAHEYTADLGALVDDVLRATGAKQVDIVAHSMGGLVTRSYLTFTPGAKSKIANVLFLSTPHAGVPGASEERVIFPSDPEWMPDHELTELDRLIVTSHSDFSIAGVAGTDTWPNQLMKAELAQPASDGPVMHCMKGSKDLYIPDSSGNYARCVDYQVVAGVDHMGILSSPAAIAEARAVLGGTYTP